MSQLSFEIRPSPKTNDHELRVLVDGRDWIGDEYMGLDPPAFFAQFATPNADLIIGRCPCGEVGCGSFAVAVERVDERIIWRTSTERASFDAQHYTDSVEAAVADHSWEDVKRRAERLVGDMLQGTVKDNLPFRWASARIRPNVIVLSYSSKDGQALPEFSWDGSTAESAVARAKQYLREQD